MQVPSPMADRFPDPESSLRTAVVGAGLAGLVCARTLARTGQPVQVFDKARGPGGRMSTRRVDADGHRLAFDHGAQYFTVRDPAFRTQVTDWRSRGLAAPWEGRLVRLEAGEVEELSGTTERWVGVPRMSALTRDLATGLDAAVSTRVGRIGREGDGFRLTGTEGEDLGTWARLVLAVPAPQAAELLKTIPEPSEDIARLTATVEAVPLAPCWAVLAAFSERLDDDLAPFLGSLNGAFVHGSPLSWVARNSAKPGRPGRDERGADCWVLHGSPEWSREHLEDDPGVIVRRLLHAFADALGVRRRELPEPNLYARAHRWRYALPEEPLDRDHLLTEGGSLGLCGDWCGGPRVEGAYLSGRALGEALGGRS